MVWFAALIFVVLTAPFWIPIAVFLFIAGAILLLVIGIPVIIFGVINESNSKYEYEQTYIEYKVPKNFGNLTKKNNLTKALRGNIYIPPEDQMLF